MSVQNSESNDFLIEIEREIEPNILTVFDINIQELIDTSQVSSTKFLRTMSLHDDEFIMDEVKYEEEEVE